MAGGSTKTVVTALVANAGIAVAKFVGFLVTGSSSMLAESVHSVADSGNQGLLLIGGKRAQRDATRRHPFGYGRERYFYAFVVALVLFTLGSAFATYEGIEKITEPHEVGSLGVAIGILLLGILLEGFALRTAVVESRHAKGDASWYEFVRHSRSPELPVVLLEDIGAMFGLVIALAAVGISSATGDPVWDGIGTLTIGILLGLIAIILAFEMRSLLLGESATQTDEDAIESAIGAGDGVVGLVHLQTQHLGPDELLVAARVQFEPGLSGAALTEAIDRVEAEVRQRVPIARVIYLEPDLLERES